LCLFDKVLAIVHLHVVSAKIGHFGKDGGLPLEMPLMPQTAAPIAPSTLRAAAAWSMTGPLP
jgi:hypothetical protein